VTLSTNAPTAAAPVVATTNAAPVSAAPAVAAEPAEPASEPATPPPVAATVPASTPSQAAPTSATEPTSTTTPVDAATPAATASSAPAAPVPVPDGSTPSAPPAPTTATTSTYDQTTPAPAQVVVLDTTFGRMVIELDDFAAPKTCANFRKLVAAGFYNGTIFHRVIPEFIIQGGDPNTRGQDRSRYGKGDPGYTLPPEIKLSHDRGAVAMARLPDAVNPQRYSNGSQFYICVAACPTLDGQYTVFGHVIAGLDVADRIAAAPRDGRDDPLERIDMKASFEPRDRALQENAPTGP
jgi:peptidyl-prolyl cis-trans isomerase B (cyclophilin B)